MQALPRSVCFHITGFGAFGTGEQRVLRNPSELVVHSLQRGTVPAPLPAHARIASACVLPVAGRAAAAAVETLPEELSTCGVDTEAATLRLHLGVNTGSTCYHLERCAWNEATFRQSDEAGWSPGELCPVSSGLPLGACFKTAVPCDALAAVLRAQGFAVHVSDDPGRFVCNYTYFASLHAAARRRQSGEQSWDALFVHLPPLEVFPHDEQLRFVCCLLAELATIYGRGDCIADDDQTEL